MAGTSLSLRQRIRAAWQAVVSSPRRRGHVLRRPYPGLMGLLVLAGALLAAAGCQPAGESLPTLIPTEYLPTAIALTVQAGRTAQAAEASGPTETPAAPTGPADTVPPAATPAPLQETESPPRASTTVRVTFAPSASATAARPPSRTPTTTRTRWPSRTPTITPTPTLPAGGVQIFQPGPGSKVTSPLVVSGSILPGDSKRVRLELIGEDGSLLVRKVLTYQHTGGARVSFYEELEFELPGMAEAGRLQVSSEDAYGRTVVLGSSELLLLSMGEADINAPGDLMEDIVIRQPGAKTLIQGGTLTVAGLARPRGSGLLDIRLVASDGKVVGYGSAVIGPAGEQGYGRFSVEITYSVQSPTWVRLTIAETSLRIPGAVQVNSLEVLVGP